MKLAIRALALLMLCVCLIGCGDEIATPEITAPPVTEAKEPETTAQPVTEPETTAQPVTGPETTAQPTDGTHVHNFEISSCLEPLLCSCGVQSAIPGHDYVDGFCTRCDAPRQDGDTASGGEVWIPTNGGTKYHISQTRGNMMGPARVTIPEAEAQGFTPCKKCYGN